MSRSTMREVSMGIGADNLTRRKHYAYETINKLTDDMDIRLKYRAKIKRATNDKQIHSILCMLRALVKKSQDSQ